MACHDQEVQSFDNALKAAVDASSAVVNSLVHMLGPYKQVPGLVSAHYIGVWPAKRSKDSEPAFLVFAALLLPKALMFDNFAMPVPNCMARFPLAAARNKPSCFKAALSNRLSPTPGGNCRSATSHSGMFKTVLM